MSYDPPRRIDPEPPLPVGPDRIALLADDLRTLRTALVVVGLLAAAALGLGIWSLLEGEDDDEGRTSLRGRTVQLDRRVDELETRVGQASEESDVTALERRLERALSSARSADRTATQSREAYDQLRGRISDLADTNEELADRVQALEQGAGDDGGGSDTDTDTDTGDGTATTP